MSELSSLLLGEPLSAVELMARLNVSQATLSRLVARQKEIIKVGRARATRYALLRPVRHIDEWPLWRIDETGRAHAAGTLRPVWPQGSYVVQDAAGQWQFYAGLPWFLNDMRPQGFLGRAWGQESATALGLPPDIRLWSDDHSLLALGETGIDMPGDWLIGQAAYQRWLTAREPHVIAQHEKAQRYPQLAERALGGEEPGSSAGGEQPKFLCYSEEAGHCLVKFSGQRDNDNSQRWRDLLRAEHVALTLLAQHNLPAARSELIEVNSQLFLEVARFDRIKQRGRRGMASLEAVGAEFLGSLSNWPVALRQLAQAKKIGAQDANRGALQWAFGRLIANSDMHAGNLSFFVEGDRLTLTPAYDMLPMALAPDRLGQMRSSVTLQVDAALPRAVWQPASAMAKAYWQQLMDDASVSDGFRVIAQRALQQLLALDATIAQMA